MSNPFPTNPYHEAEKRQQNGGFKSPILGGGLQLMGQGLQKIPPSFQFRKIHLDVGGTLAGKFLENVGKRVSAGLPQDKSKFDILQDMGHSHKDSLEIIRQNNTSHK